MISETQPMDPHDFDTVLLEELFGLSLMENRPEPVTETGWVRFEYPPYPAPRPRAKAVLRPNPAGSLGPKSSWVATVYNPPQYTDWKTGLALLFKTSRLPRDAYNAIDLLLCIPLPKSLSKRAKAELAWKLHDRKPDFDNFTKGILDALQDSGLIQNDSRFGSGTLEKIWIPDYLPACIWVNLKKSASPRTDLGKIPGMLPKGDNRNIVF